MKAICGGLTVVAAALCAGASAEPLRIVATTEVLADMARQVAGSRATVETLIPAGADPHSWSPSARDAARVAEADIVIANGLGLEAALEPFLASAATTAVRVEAAAKVEAVAGSCDHAGHDHDHEHAHGTLDPHAWMDARAGMQYVDAIRDALVAVDGANAEDYAARAELYSTTLRVVDAWAKRELAKVPAESRTIVADHDAFAYFARAYGFETLSVRGAAGGAQATGERVAAVRAALGDRTVPAVFCESAASERFMRTVAEDAGARFGGMLHVETLPPPPDDSYVGLFRANVSALRDSLR